MHVLYLRTVGTINLIPVLKVISKPIWPISNLWGMKFFEQEERVEMANRYTGSPDKYQQK